MQEEAAQQLTGELEPAPAANRRASLKDDTQRPRKSPRRPRLRGEHIIRFLASLLCLGAAGFSLWYWRDPLWFLIFCGIATGAINPREIVGSMLQQRSGQRDETGELDQ
jgi:hypothetical protein